MGFIKAALSAGISSFQDSKFKEAITLPEAVPATALAIKGQRSEEHTSELQSQR